MNISGFIVEYNPFHNGHLYHFNQSKKTTKSDYTVAIMSGHFLQRGEPALFNKWYRTKMALTAGVDIVIELPVVYSCQSAELFSYGAIQLLEKLGIIDYLVFGSECSDLKDLKGIAKIFAFEPKDYQDFLKEELKKGNSFPVARTRALEKYISIDNYLKININAILQQPNNILGIEYIKWLFRLKSKIIPKIIPRIGSNYHDKKIDNPFASATAIRNQILNYKTPVYNLKEVLPNFSLTFMQEAMNNQSIPAEFSQMSKTILSILFRKSAKELKDFLDINEGLNDRMINCLTTNSLEKYIELVKTKRYTRTRIQRILCHILLDLRKQDLNLFKENDGVQYVRILGFSKKGRELLPLLKRNCTIPIITNLSKSYKKLNPIQKKMVDFDVLATNLYNIHFEKSTPYQKGLDFYYPPIMENKKGSFNK